MPTPPSVSRSRDRAGRARHRGWRSAPLLIAGSFVGAVVSAWQVYRSSCAQIYTAHRATLSYAQATGALLAADAERALAAGMAGALGGAAPAATAGALREAVARAASDAAACRCAVVPDAEWVARVDLTTGAVDAEGAAAPADELRAWAEGVATRPTAPAGPGTWGGVPAGVRTGAATLGGRRRLVAWRVVPHAGTPAGAGAVHVVAAAPEGAARAALAFAAARRTVHVPDVRRGVPAESVLVVELTDAAGHPLFRSPLAAGGTESQALAGRLRDAFPVPLPWLGGLTLRAAVRPGYVTAVAGDVWSWDQAQLIIGLLTVTAGLGAVALLQYRRERAMTQLRADFVAGVSHELRTPLAQIRMFSEMLRLGWVRSDAERDRAVEVIDQEARRLTQLVENVLRFSASERGALAVARAQVAVAPLVREVADAFAPLAAARGTRVLAEVAGPAADGRDPAWHVLADRDALWQALLNVLDNAVKYGPAGQAVRLGVAAAADGGPVRITVDDEGPGIPPAERERVWEPFHRLARDRAAGTTGNGIGLSVVRELLRALGGDASIGPVPGAERGTRVTLTLPAAPAAAAPAGAYAPAGGGVAAGAA